MYLLINRTITTALYSQSGQELDARACRSGNTQRVLKVIAVHRGHDCRYGRGLGSCVPVLCTAAFRLRCCWPSCWNTPRGTDCRRRTSKPEWWRRRQCAAIRCGSTKWQLQWFTYAKTTTAPRHYGETVFYNAVVVRRARASHIELVAGGGKKYGVYNALCAIISTI